jgi:hypothetical protein
LCHRAGDFIDPHKHSGVIEEVADAAEPSNNRARSDYQGRSLIDKTTNKVSAAVSLPYVIKGINSTLLFWVIDRMMAIDENRKVGHIC